ncbi:MAG: hypothetical protein HOY78_20160, partial [Saccharothrix sp.]|nr:hypothetical protein [Saccharothrix sp.]
MRKRLLTVCLAALLAVPTAVLTAASAGARPAPCSRADLLFCEDFEHVRTGGATSLKWGVDTRDGTLTVERQGRNKVLHAHTVGNGKAFLRVDHFAAPGNSFHGRARIRVAAFPDSPDWAHYTLIETTGVGPEVIRPLGGQYVPTLDKA